jgi:hypothetical protein
MEAWGRSGNRLVVDKAESRQFATHIREPSDGEAEEASLEVISFTETHYPLDDDALT